MTVGSFLTPPGVSKVEFAAYVASNPGGAAATNSTVAGYVTAAGATKTALDAAYSAYRSIREFGATGGSDDTAAIQAAIDAVSTAGGGTVFFPAGSWNSSTLRLKSKVRLLGAGKGVTRLLARPNLTTALITLNDVNVERAAVEGMEVNGNRANQTLATAHCISFDNTSPSTSAGRHILRDLMVRDAKGDGIHTTGTGISGTAVGIDVYVCDGRGIWHEQEDWVWVGADVAQSGREGIWAAGGNTRWIGCNSWMNGRVNISDGVGWSLRGSRSMLVGCQAQDNSNHGLLILGASLCVVSGFIADSNGASGEGVVSGLTAAGIALNGAGNNRITGTCLNRFTTHTQTYALSLGGSSGRNVIDLVALDNNADLAGTVDDNKLTFNGASYDPLGIGYVTTSIIPGGNTVWGGANEARYLRAVSGGTVAKIGIHVAVQSGNISLAVYRKNGTGRTAVPGTRLATTGAVACPAVGYVEIALDTTVNVQPGDFLAMSCDNTTASFIGGSGAQSDLFKGASYSIGGAHPLAATAPTVTANSFRVPHLIGV